MEAMEGPVRNPANEGPNYRVTNTTPDFEIRKYEPSFVAEMTIDPEELTGNNQNGRFTDTLANYVGAFIGRISVTAPVITKGGEDNEPLIVQVAFPEQENTALQNVDQPMDPRVTVKHLEKRTYGVHALHGAATDEVVREEARKLKGKLEENDYKVVGEHLLARYNTSLTPQPLRADEILVPIDDRHLYWQ